MSDDNDPTTADEVKGRVKQAAGDLTGDEELKNEGEVDEKAGKVKGKVDEAADTVRDKVDETVERFKD